jgi:ComF family protein
MGDPREFHSIEADGQPARATPWLSRSLAWLSDAVFPPVCLSCRRALLAHDALCPKCWSKIDFIRAPLCDRLGSPLPYDTGGTMISAAAAADPPDYARARAVGHYSGVLRELIHDFKFSDRHAVRALLARLMSDAGAGLLAEAEVVVPVPLSRRRLLSRRFNQAALLAQTVARAAGLPFEPLALVRTRATPPQVGLTRNERKLNVRGVFAVPERFKARIAGRHVLLVDDVLTTGATCGAASRALLRAGAVSVDVLALALVTDKSMMEAS